MKVIIIEGTDNTGKDTIIKKLKNIAEQNIVFHCEKPTVTKTPDEQAIEQEKTFAELLGKTVYGYQFICNCEENFCPDGGEYFLIHNRSWYGEYVYGCMYRDNAPEQVVEMIHNIEAVINKIISEEDICYITLLSNNADFLVRNDDGLSISAAKKELIEEETKRFEEIHSLSNIKNKHIVYVNEGIEFRPSEDIFNEVLDCIYGEDK